MGQFLNLSIDEVATISTARDWRMVNTVLVVFTDGEYYGIQFSAHN